MPVSSQCLQWDDQSAPPVCSKERCYLRHKPFFSDHLQHHW